MLHRRQAGGSHSLQREGIIQMVVVHWTPRNHTPLDRRWAVRKVPCVVSVGHHIVMLSAKVTNPARQRTMKESDPALHIYWFETH